MINQDVVTNLHSLTQKYAKKDLNCKLYKSLL